MAIGFHAQQERRLLKLSFYAAGVFVIVALASAIITASDAILFDGVYSLIAFIMAMLTLKVAQLVELPDDDRFHFGYTAIEPTLNLFKSLIIMATCLYAVIGSIKSLMTGGNPSEYGLAMGYGIFAMLGCFAVAIIMKAQGKALRSDLVNVDAHTWLIDGVLSASILVGFVIAYFLSVSGFEAYAPYVDPILLIVLGLTMLPVPVKIMLESLNEVINKAPPEAVTTTIERRLADSLKKVPYEHVEVRISKRGRDTYMLVHIIVNDSFKFATVSELDDIRLKCERDLKEWDSSIIMDILFIRDPELAE